MQLVQLSSYSFIDLGSFEIELLNEIRPTRKGGGGKNYAITFIYSL